MGAAGQKRLIAAVQRPGLRRDRRWRQGFDRRQARVIAGGCRQRRRHIIWKVDPLPSPAVRNSTIKIP